MPRLLSLSGRTGAGFQFRATIRSRSAPGACAFGEFGDSDAPNGPSRGNPDQLDPDEGCLFLAGPEALAIQYSAGEATKIELYVPTTTPTTRANANTWIP